MTIDRDQIRKTFFDTWQKFNRKEPLSELEQQILTVILAHSEYHSILNNPEKELKQDYTADTNPFLHMGLHLSLLEQLKADRPNGIKACYQKLVNKCNDAHQSEHLMMKVMADIIWEAQQKNILPDEQAYLKGLEKLC